MKVENTYNPEMGAGKFAVNYILGWPRWVKRATAMAFDIFLCIFTLWLAFSFRLNTWGPLAGIQLLTIPASLVIALPLFIILGLYRAIFRFIGWAAFIAIFRAVSIYGIIFATFFTLISVPGIPRTVGILQPMLLLLMVAISRLAAREILGGAYRGIIRRNAQSRALIYGAGSVGRQLASALRNGDELLVVGYLDDDVRLQGALVDGVRVYAPSKLKEVVQRSGATTVLLAVPHTGSEHRRAIIENLRGAHVAVRNVPNVTQLARGRVKFSDFQDLALEDLLGRPAVSPDQQLLEKNIRDKIVMVTGAGGSIGGELCRQISNIVPKKLILVDMNEYALYAIDEELNRRFGQNDFEILPFLGSVRDRGRMQEIIGAFKPDTIYHAAAYKHVPLVERNLVEGVSNNVFGTLVAASVAADLGVKSFVLVSTDKAVRPTNVMGASKRIAELVLQALAATNTNTTFSMVRFGNVLGSSGSVIPLFRQQILDRQPITITHSEVTRYFMTIPESAQLVIQASAMAKGGDVFVLDMGEPVKIKDLATKMVELSGLTVKNDDNPDGDIEFLITGLRPAEKLYEELLLGNNPQPTSHQRIMTAQEEYFDWPELEAELQSLRNSIENRDYNGLIKLLSKLVSGFQTGSELFDPLALSRNFRSIPR